MLYNILNPLIYVELFHQVGSACKPIDDEQHIADIHDDAALIVGQVLDIAPNALPVSIEVNPDKFPATV